MFWVTAMKNTKKDLKTLVMILLSALLYALSLKMFINAGGLFPGGFSGLSVLATRLISKTFQIEIPFAVFYIALNIIPTFLVFNYVGKRFTIFSVIQYLMVSLFTLIIPNINLTADIILISVFGGILAGFATSLSLAVNASSGGTDFLAIYAANRFKREPWSAVMVGNVIMLGIAGLFFGWDKALYSIIYQFVYSQVVSARHLRYKHVSLIIITSVPDEMMTQIFSTLRHGITKLWGEGGYSHTPKSLLYMVVNEFEVDEVIEACRIVDPAVFISVNKTERVVGNYYQKPLE
jgi:uncharacterized membrane-anchored protein YitT (DUF2179 family)